MNKEGALKKLWQNFLIGIITSRINLFNLLLHVYLLSVITKRRDQRVISGPFKGMKFNLDLPYDWFFLPMFLGTYELEIHSAFANLSNFRFDQIINLGASEGYYAVGMALKWPQATVYAFESMSIYSRKISKIARDNLVADRVYIRGRCNCVDLIDLLKPNKSTLLMLDVEGEEINLLEPQVVLELRQATVLVELHDVCVPECAKIIEERFGDTHNISKYISRPRTIKDFPLPLGDINNPIVRLFALKAVTEYRGPQQKFFLMIPKKCNTQFEVIK